MRLGLRAVIAAVSCVVVVGASLATTSAVSAAATASAEWHVAASLARGTDDTAISCPASTRCWALESGQLLSSPNGGQSWIVRNALVPPGIAALNDMDCPKSRARRRITA
jgi:hypothetical protein